MAAIPLACFGCLLGSIGHKLIVAMIGFGFLLAAWLVRRQRHEVARGFEVLPSSN